MIGKLTGEGDEDADAEVIFNFKQRLLSIDQGSQSLLFLLFLLASRNSPLFYLQVAKKWQNLLFFVYSIVVGVDSDRSHRSPLGR